MRKVRGSSLLPRTSTDPLAALRRRDRPPSPAATDLEGERDRLERRFQRITLHLISTRGGAARSTQSRTQEPSTFGHRIAAGGGRAPRGVGSAAKRPPGLRVFTHAAGGGRRLACGPWPASSASSRSSASTTSRSSAARTPRSARCTEAVRPGRARPERLRDHGRGLPLHARRGRRLASRCTTRSTTSTRPTSPTWRGGPSAPGRSSTAPGCPTTSPPRSSRPTGACRRSTART